MTKLERAIKTVRLEWMVLWAVVQAEMEHGESGALETQLARFDEAVFELEQAQRDSKAA